MDLFGYTITRKDKKDEESVSFAPPGLDDGAIELAPGSSYGTYLDLEGKAKNEGEMVTKYREISTQPECDSAIQDILNESIVIGEDGEIVDINLDEIDYPDKVKALIREEFEYILKLLNFNKKAYEIYRRWYVDGRLFYHLIIDPSNPQGGIQELRYIDPRRIRKVIEHVKEKDPRTGVTLYKKAEEYFVYNQKGTYQTENSQGVKIAVDTISYCHSGIIDPNTALVQSHLHKAMRPFNQLRMLEHAVVIYRLSRAPERRIFYIDVGNLPKNKSEQYMRNTIAKHKNKVVYNAQTGAVEDQRKFMTMMEDFWFPRREGGRGTEVTTLPGGVNLGEMEDVDYFRAKLYESLNVPISRLQSESVFNVGRASEITRDEVKFAKFIDRLRNQFSQMFSNLLEIHLALKGITTRAEWKKLSQEISFDFQNDNHYSELKEAEIIRERFALLSDADQFVGQYVSSDWIMRKILRLNDEEIEEMKKEMKELGDEPDEGDAGGFDQFGGEPPAPPAAPPPPSPAPGAPKKPEDPLDREVA